MVSKRVAALILLGVWVVEGQSDSTSFYKKGEPSKDCDWVAQWEPRCDTRGEEGVVARDACPEACASSTGSSSSRTSADYVTFPYGVKSGMPSSSTAVLWTKIKPVAPTLNCIQLYVQVSDSLLDGDIDDEDAVIDGSYRDNIAYACRDDFWTAKLEIDSLEPATRYYYRFKAYIYDYEVSADAASRPSINSWLKPAVSKIGTFKTLPEPFAPTSQYKVGVLGCSDLSKMPFNSWYQLSKIEDLDLVVHTGDYLYADGQTYDEPSHQVPMMLVSSSYGFPHRYPETLEEYTTIYDRLMLDPDAQELHRKAAWVFNIGDHEILNNYDTNTYSTQYDTYLSAGGTVPYEELAELAVEAWFLNLPIMKNTTQHGYWRTEKDVGLPVGDLLYMHVIDDYSRAENIIIQEIQGSNVVTVDTLTPTMPTLEYDENGEVTNANEAKEALIELDQRLLETRRVSEEQIARIAAAYEMYGNTTWKVTSTGVPQTVHHTTIISQGAYDENATTSGWPYSSQGIAIADMAAYAELERELYEEGSVKYPFIAIYQNEGDVSRRELQDIMHLYPNNVNFYGDYHTSIESQGFYYKDLINITSVSPHRFENGMYVDEKGEVIMPMLTSVKAGVQSFQFSPGSSNGAAWGEEVDVARGWVNDITKYNTPGTIQVDGHVDSSRSVLVATFTHETLDLEWIDGGGYETANRNLSTQAVLNFNQFLSNPNEYEAETFGTFVNVASYDEQSESIVHPHWKRVDAEYSVGHMEIDAVTEPCTTAYVNIISPFHEGVTDLPADYPFSLCEFTTTPCST